MKYDVITLKYISQQEFPPTNISEMYPNLKKNEKTLQIQRSIILHNFENVPMIN